MQTLIDTIAKELGKRSLFAIFDRDGTLVPFHRNPEKAIMTQSVKALLQGLATCKNARIALLSARDLRQLGKDFNHQDFNKRDLILAGNYGMEISFPDGKNFIHAVAAASRPLLAEAKKSLTEKIPNAANIILEDHELSLCLHWHQTPVKHLQTVHNIVRQLESAMPNLFFRTLPTSYEIWPPIKWDKACGLDQMKQILNLDEKNWLLLYVGDSSSDEPAFQWINDHRGISIHIGKNVASAAKFSLESPAAMIEFLSLLVQLMQDK